MQANTVTINGKSAKRITLGDAVLWENAPAMPEGLLLWYDVARQGCTNDSLRANPRLIDLSGNNRDARLMNFGYTATSGMDNGELISDGVNDYVNVGEIPILSDHTLFIRARQLSGNRTNGTLIHKYSSPSQNSSVLSILGNYNGNFNTYRIVSFGAGTTINTAGVDTHIMTPTKYNGAQIGIGGYADDDLTNIVLFARYTVPKRDSVNYFGKWAFRSMLLFNRSLTTDEIEEVKKYL